MNNTKRSWPSVDNVYIDECGVVEPTVFEAARELWPYAERLAESTIRDEETGFQLMVKAVTIVSRRLYEIRVDNLQPFLFQVYKRLILAELKKQNRRNELEAQWKDDLASLHNEPDEIDRKILFEQLCARMDGWTRNAFQLRVLGYTFEEIGKSLGMKPNHVRSEFSKRLARLREELRR